MTKERVYETAAETAKKIRLVLKKAFPNVKFSVNSKTYAGGSSVFIHWTDGPLQIDVDAIVQKFNSSKVDGMQDMVVTQGYEWEGKIVVGADFIETSRTLSKDRRGIIHVTLKHDYVPDVYGDFTKLEWVRAEQQLIELGELEGFPSQIPVGGDTREEQHPAGRDNVVLFPTADPLKMTQDQVHHLMARLTPEEKLKIVALQAVLGPVRIAESVAKGERIDDIFRSTANRLFG